MPSNLSILEGGTVEVDLCALGHGGDRGNDDCIHNDFLVDVDDIVQGDRSG